MTNPIIPACISAAATFIASGTLYYSARNERKHHKRGDLYQDMIAHFEYAKDQLLDPPGTLETHESHPGENAGTVSDYYRLQGGVERWASGKVRSLFNQYRADRSPESIDALLTRLRGEIREPNRFNAER